MPTQGRPSCGALESSTIIHFKAMEESFLSQTFPLCFSPLFPNVSLPSTNKLPRHHHHLPWRCWLLSVPQVKAVLPRRGQKFKSSVYPQSFWESVQHHLAMLLYSRHFRQSACDKKRERQKIARLRGFLDAQGNNTDLKLYLFSLVLHDFLCGCCTPFKISHIFWRCNDRVAWWNINKHFI